MAADKQPSDNPSGKPGQALTPEGGIRAICQNMDDQQFWSFANHLFGREPSKEKR